MMRKFARSSVPFGSALSSEDLADEPLISAIRKHCQLIVPEYEMKWGVLAASTSAWQAVDALFNWATSVGIGCRGHTIWWHGSVPKQFFDMAPVCFRQAAMGHLAKLVRRYRGRMHSWDVLNEPLEPADGRSYGLRESPFFRAFGRDLVREAFTAAASIEPDGCLVLNEMGLEYDTPEAEAKRRAMLRLLERELGAGTPIHCLGMQGHLDATAPRIDHPALRVFLRELRALGLKVMVTELDVSDQSCPRNIRCRDIAVARAYHDFLRTLVEESEPLAVLTWGLSDRRTWLQYARPRPDGAAVRPLPLDRACRHKLAFLALKAALGSQVPS